MSIKLFFGGFKMDFSTYIIRSQRLAGYLMLKGFKLHEIKINKDDVTRNVFMFTNSEELLKAIQHYRQNKSNFVF
jgi:hypothetical protein